MPETKTILITGGTGKIGSILINHFALAGYKIFFTSRNISKIKKLENSLSNNYYIKGIKIDHTEPNSTQKIIEYFHSQQVFPEILINNVRDMEFLKFSDNNGIENDSIWFNELKLAVMVPSELTIKLAKLQNSILKNVINISSIYGVSAPNLNLYLSEEDTAPIHYGVSKAAQIHLTKELAVRLAKLNIRVNTVTYGGIEGRTDNNFISRYSQLCPQGRMLNEKDISGPIEFLISESSSGITGHNLIVDGGWTIW
jgi:NAD(P)-dependent dehydrogenase (short-subunit alcohol dehydrogenase family)